MQPDNDSWAWVKVKGVRGELRSVVHSLFQIPVKFREVLLPVGSRQLFQLLKGQFYSHRANLLNDFLLPKSDEDRGQKTLFISDRASSVWVIKEAQK